MMSWLQPSLIACCITATWSTSAGTAIGCVSTPTCIGHCSRMWKTPPRRSDRHGNQSREPEKEHEMCAIFIRQDVRGLPPALTPYHPIFDCAVLLCDHFIVPNQLSFTQFFTHT